MIAVARGSVRAVIVWLGATAYLLYNSVMFLFATPFNRLFLLYVAMCALSIWTAITVLGAIDVQPSRDASRARSRLERSPHTCGRSRL